MEISNLNPNGVRRYTRCTCHHRAATLLRLDDTHPPAPGKGMGEGEEVDRKGASRERGTKERFDRDDVPRNLDEHVALLNLTL